ncbi:bifunctional ATP-dependent DNA helicase/DNA polymerase III subunit epsilon [Methanobrevibacter cuticularis]|uniref:Bifunctional ATP-dependent DNA helicase/DNA polymerase III subunit epsilon n=1 Tax=Methanobrevibacter cuticularis TaxID=47311 RepID=A0A166DSJ2_9EURY|nr:ATP-dependent DNA helicase [Methanobrevibacter cuticularis]KZX15909.1 bifunctional ATP-dependent DNA helicase/DNA polymerase III subunit epsilon [Methanobrevibacter cuticularis]
MSNSLFCSKCGMMKNSCICKNSNSLNKNSNVSSTKTPKITESAEIPDSYSISDHSLPKNIINQMKKGFPNIDDQIIENFPFENPREGQLEIISDINEAIEDGFKYIILEAGTGTGKSGIATTLSRMYESAYILTMTKQLQSQYANEFGFPLVKGRGNFYCLQDDLDSTCDIGTCKTTPSSKNFFCPYGVGKNPTLGATEAFEDSFGGPIFFQSDEHCHYWQQKANSINSPITLMNYDYAILELNYVKHFAPRNLLILDEAHNIENKLMRSMELNLYNKSLQNDIKKSITPNIVKQGDIKDWIMEVDAIKDAYNDIDIKDLPKNKAERINSTTRRLKQLKENLEKEPKNWVIDPNEAGVSFKPLRVHQYAKDYLFKHGEVCLFLSATILSHKMFSKWLGLKPQEVYHIKADSPFPPAKRPIELKIAGKMSANRVKYTAPKTLPILEEILKRHKNDKGLIHTNSYKCQEYITKKMPSGRLISHNSLNRERVLDHFEKSKDPLVLASPSMSEGVDLPYDKCRFQVIYKVPFPYLGDKQVNMRKKRDQRWYAYKTVMTLMQAYGRGMRAEDDSCYTYILDGDIRMLFKSPMYKSLVPEFFKEAIIERD